jgi:DNA-binding protein YbaB
MEVRMVHRSPHLNESAMQFVRDEMKRSFARDYPPIEVSEADLVSVVMDERFQVHAISLRNTAIGTKEAAKIEQALLNAFNKAVAEVTKRSAERLTRAIEEAGTYVAPSEQ